MRSPAALPLLAMVGPVLLGGCSGDHSRLAAGGGTSSATGSDTTSSDTPKTTESSTSTTTESVVIEPPGPTKLTFVNGVVDYTAIRLCFVPYPAGAGAEEPWPGVDGLPFARGEEVALAQTIPAATDVEVVAIGGLLAASDGKTCHELIDSPPLVTRVQSLGVVPESAFAVEKSVLLVAYGCLGGETHTDGAQEQACGAGYTPDTPTAALAAGFLSRLGKDDKVSMQFVHAVAAMTGQGQLRLTPVGGPSQLVVEAWTLGAVAPFPPYDFFGALQLGDTSKVAIDVYAYGSGTPTASTSFTEAFSNSPYTVSQVKDGSAFVFVAVGAAPGLAAGAWYSAFTHAVVSP